MLAASAIVAKLFLVAGACAIGNVKTIGSRIIPELVYDDAKKKKKKKARGQVPGVYFDSAYPGFMPRADRAWRVISADGTRGISHMGTIDVDIESSMHPGSFHRVH
eukprot:3494034-Prymnesium_polylepis.1